jgi:hypothetical protein
MTMTNWPRYHLMLQYLLYGKKQICSGYASIRRNPQSPSRTEHHQLTAYTLASIGLRSQFRILVRNMSPDYDCVACGNFLPVLNLGRYLSWRPGTHSVKVNYYDLH